MLLLHLFQKWFSLENWSKKKIICRNIEFWDCGSLWWSSGIVLMLHLKHLCKNRSVSWREVWLSQMYCTFTWWYWFDNKAGRHTNGPTVVIVEWWKMTSIQESKPPLVLPGQLLKWTPEPWGIMWSTEAWSPSSRLACSTIRFLKIPLSALVGFNRPLHPASSRQPSSSTYRKRVLTV